MKAKRTQDLLLLAIGSVCTTSRVLERFSPIHAALKATELGNIMHSYIGISKLSCRDCQKFLWILNSVSETDFCIRGCRGKSYLGCEEVLEETDGVYDHPLRVCIEKRSKQYGSPDNTLREKLSHPQYIGLT